MSGPDDVVAARNAGQAVFWASDEGQALKEEIARRMTGNQYSTGRVQPESERVKRSAALKGRPKTAEHAANIRAGQQRAIAEDPHWWDRNRQAAHTPEANAKRSKALSGKPKTAQHRAALSAAARNRSPDHYRRGAENGNATLIPEEVIAIRAAAGAGETFTSIAARYQVSRGTIRNIVRGRTWRHVEG